MFKEIIQISKCNFSQGAIRDLRKYVGTLNTCRAKRPRSTFSSRWRGSRQTPFELIESRNVDMDIPCIVGQTGSETPRAGREGGGVASRDKHLKCQRALCITDSRRTNIQRVFVHFSLIFAPICISLQNKHNSFAVTVWKYVTWWTSRLDFWDRDEIKQQFSKFLCFSGKAVDFLDWWKIC